MDAWIFVACALGAVLMRGAGCTWNDLTDRDLDARVKRTRSRPLPSGQVSPLEARVWLAVQAMAAFAILLTFNNVAILLGIVSLVPVVIYPYAKRFTWWPQAFLGIAFNWGALLAWAAHAQSIEPAPVLLYLSGIAWTLFYDTIYAHQDKEDDAMVGIKSTARLFEGATKVWLTGFVTASTAFMVLAVAAAIPPGSRPSAFALALIGVVLYAWHLIGQLNRLETDNPDNCLRLFRSNRDAGLLPAIGFGAAALVGVL